MNRIDGTKTTARRAYYTHEEVIAATFRPARSVREAQLIGYRAYKRLRENGDIRYGAFIGLAERCESPATARARRAKRPAQLPSSRCA